MSELQPRHLSVFESPQAGECYCIGADVAEGGPRGHFSAAQVLHRPQKPDQPLRQVAVYRERVDCDVYGVDLGKIARYYNWAWIGIENNAGWGVAVTTKLFHEERYPRLYWEQPTGHENSQARDRIGWRTSLVSRPFMIAQLAELIRLEQILLLDRMTVEECLNFRQHPDTARIGAMKGAFDDLVLALAIAIQMHRLCGMDCGPPRKEIEEEDDEIVLSSELTDREFIKRAMQRQRRRTLALALHEIEPWELEFLARRN